MNKLFDSNNKIWFFFGKLIDATILHLIWLVSCIPIFTFGPSTTALHYALMTDISEENAHYVKAFFHSFKINFKQGILLGLIYLFMGIGLCYGLYFYANISEDSLFYAVCHALTIVLVIAYIISAQYVFALQARFNNFILCTVRNSLLIGIKNIGWTMTMSVVFLLPWIIIYFTNFFPILIIGYGLVVYINSFILNKILEPYINKLKEKQTIEKESINDKNRAVL